jgi:hypothetical protein
MSIPLDRLYHYIENIAEKIHGDNVLIYRFWPHGSKNINDLKPLRPEAIFLERAMLVGVWCNDQEPLDHDYYSINIKPNTMSLRKFSFLNLSEPKNLNYQQTIYEKNILLHSEKRSRHLEKYQSDNELINVYYWSHALISRDWFRYAQHEIFKKDSKKIFLIYNRAWSGTREYRLRFTDLLIENNLLDQCQTTCNVVDPDLKIHYASHQFKNSWCRPTNLLENLLPASQADATNSADFVTKDYDSTDVEVVLETLFIDDRLHLTEKSLRPIACAQPFILVSTHGSLEYLRSYGFKTFDTVWDESYDQIQNAEQRLESIVDVMKQIANWDQPTRQIKMAQAQAIADHNRQWFFSQDFFDLIVDELTTNLKLAFKELHTCNNFQPWIDRWNNHMTYPEVIDFLETSQDPDIPSQQAIDHILKIAKEKLNQGH